MEQLQTSEKLAQFLFYEKKFEEHMNEQIGRLFSQKATPV